MIRPRGLRHQKSGGSNAPPTVDRLLCHTLLSREQEKALAVARDAGDGEAVHTLVRHNLKLAWRVAGDFSKSHEERQERFGDAVLALYRAAEDYDGSQRFTTYAMWWIRSSLQRGQWRDEPIHVPYKPYMDLKREGALPVRTVLTRSGFRSLPDRESRSELPARRVDDRDEVESYLSVLTPLQRDVVLGYHGIDRDRPQSFDAIARAEGVYATAIADRYHKGMDRLRRKAAGQHFLSNPSEAISCQCSG